MAAISKMRGSISCFVSVLSNRQASLSRCVSIQRSRNLHQVTSLPPVDALNPLREGRAAVLRQFQENPPALIV